ncbi:MAG: radical SAM protein [Thermoproteota archaeon]
MTIISYNHFWDAIMRLPTTRKMLTLALSKCGGCGKSVLDSALDDYVGSNEEKCEHCRLYSLIIRFWMEVLRNALAADKSKVQKILADSYARRAIKSVVRGFIHFGVTKPLSIYSPLLVVWNFTYKCNLNCKHCYIDAGTDSRQELTTPEALAVVDQLAEAGVTSLAFSGGEPLMRKDFFEVARHAVDRGLYVSLATNGTLLDKRTVKRLKEIGIHYVEVSIDSIHPEVHDQFRGKPGAFHKSLSGLKNCAEEDMITCLAVTASKKNLEDLPDLLELGMDIPVARFTLFNFVPVGRGKENVSLDPSSEEREELMKVLLNKILEDPDIAILTTIPQLARVALQYQGEQDHIIMPLAHMQSTGISRSAVALADFIGGCGAGRFYCAISPEGYLQPCVFLPINVGDLKLDNFEEIWLKSNLFNLLRDRSTLKGPCGECDFKYVCGGCRARAFAYHNDILASDPGCILVSQSS